MIHKLHHVTARHPGPSATYEVDFEQDVVAGLMRQPPQLPCKYFYDARGSELFDRICELDEYYPTRTELQIMEQFAAEMGSGIGGHALLVEYGSGSSLKTRVLLDHLREPVAYIPVDISREHLLRAAARLTQDYPQLPVLPVCADFTSSFALPPVPRPAARTTVYFPGSTIGNFSPPQARRLLKRMRTQCGYGGGVLIGIDLQKDPAVLEAAYNDRAGVTAEFNRNLLHRIREELDADLDVRRFRHQAVYNRREGRIEMYLISMRDQTIAIGGRRFSFPAGTRICTEYSYKYTIQGFTGLAAQAGLQLQQYWTDAKRYFAVMYLVREGSPRRRGQ